MYFLSSELRTFKNVQKEEDLETTTLLGPAPEMLKFNHPTHVVVQADLINSEILVSGKASTIIQGACGRCLGLFEKDINSSFKQSFEITQDRIDVTYYIKEAIILDLPVHAVCRESCQGLCPVCGINLNESKCNCDKSPYQSHWDILKDIELPPTPKN